MTPDAAGWQVIGDVARQVAILIFDLAMSAATNVGEFRGACVETTMCAFIDFRIIRQQEASRAHRTHRLLAKPSIQLRSAFEL